MGSEGRRRRVLDRADDDRSRVRLLHLLLVDRDRSVVRQPELVEPERVRAVPVVKRPQVLDYVLLGLDEAQAHLDFQDEVVDGVVDGEAVDGDEMLGNISNDSVVEKLNAYIGAIADREYLNPEKAIGEMRQKLMRVGIHFGDVQFTEESGEISVPLIQYGGAFGKSGDTPIDEFDDEQESGRSINFVYERTAGGTHRILAKIM